MAFIKTGDGEIVTIIKTEEELQKEKEKLQQDEEKKDKVVNSEEKKSLN